MNYYRSTKNREDWENRDAARQERGDSGAFAAENQQFYNQLGQQMYLARKAINEVEELRAKHVASIERWKNDPAAKQEKKTFDKLGKRLLNAWRDINLLVKDLA